MVESNGTAVRTYASARQFLDSFNASQFGCLVVEVQLTGMSGLELQEHLRDQGIALPAIVVTAGGNVPTAVRAIRNGAIAFLEKPLREEELWENIRKAFDRHRKYTEHKAHQAELKARLARLAQQED